MLAEVARATRAAKARAKIKARARAKIGTAKGRLKSTQAPRDSSTERCTGTSASTSVFRFTHSSADSVRLCATAGEASAVDCGSGSAGCSATSATPG